MRHSRGALLTLSDIYIEMALQIRLIHLYSLSSFTLLSGSAPTSTVRKVTSGMMKGTILSLGLGWLLLLSLWTTVVRADADDSTDVLTTFGQSTMNDTSPYPYHESISAWYESFLKVALQRKAWPVDSYADADDFAPIFELLEATYPNQTVTSLHDDEWAEAFNFKGQELFRIADGLRSNNATQNATNYYM